jgi:hypothetical protein
LVPFSLLRDPTRDRGTPRVTGRIVGADGYGLLAPAPNGQRSMVELGRRGAFSVPDRRGWTLQLLSPDSHYLGPVVLRHEAKKGWEVSDSP